MVVLHDVQYMVADERPRTYEYEPEYFALVFRRDEKPEVIIARSDCMIEKIWRKTIQDLLPEEYCQRGMVNSRISICPVNRDGEINERAIGYLYIYDGRVLGPSYTNGMSEAQIAEASKILFEWLEGSATYTFVDYTMEEIADSMKKGIEDYYKEVNINVVRNLDTEAAGEAH